ncbi:MAG: bifunctional aspartate kinase/homoserine dehydrogenase I [Bacteroidetes bacterium]|nr:bifunctional aspartate kinase/homoserine dehydrogenase I [Bacteroidota bacterium]
MKVLKFGGSCIRSAGDIQNMVRIIKRYPEGERLIIVVSAFDGITDQLNKCGHLAENVDVTYQDLLKEIEFRHLDIVNDILSVTKQSKVKAQVKMLLNDVEGICSGIFLLCEYSARTKDALLAFGETLSAYIISEFMNHEGLETVLIDSRELIITDDNFGAANVDLPLTYERIKRRLDKINSYVIIPGFISASHNNYTTTLGRGGSDYTAAIIAAAVQASVLDKWTNVDGIMTADPKAVRDAFPIETLSFEEAMELAHFGAKVIYPPTLYPVFEKGIPVCIKNAFSPEKTGTKISALAKENGQVVKGLSVIKNIALVTVSGSGMVGIPGIADRFFGTMAVQKINIIFITQASSEHSITVGIKQSDVELADKAISDEFSGEISLGKVNEVEIEQGLSIVAIVGDKMKSSIGLAGRAFHTLGKNGINIRAIAQGSTERNISMVIDQNDVRKALNVLHESFFLSDTRRVHLFLIGVGSVGSALLQQINEQYPFLKEKQSIELKVIGLANSKKMLFLEDGIKLTNWKKELDSSGEPMDSSGFIRKVKELNLRNSVFIDETADEEITKIYDKFLSSSISVVTSNKIAASSGYNNYKRLLELARKKNVKFLYETNVGAGLPIIKTIHDLIDSGDRVLKIQAVLSGSLNFIFNSFDKTTSFAEAVKIAQTKGYTEPDPRVDLSGDDVRRKILILARESGAQLEIDSIECEPFLPESCLKVNTVAEFYDELDKHNCFFEKLRKRAETKGYRLRYIAQYENGKAGIGLQSVGPDHPFFKLDGKDNIVAINTDRYMEQPLVVKGAGAGAEVTASGVFADIMRIANQ